MGTQTLNHSFERGGQSGAELTPDSSRLAENGWGLIALHEALVHMHGITVAGSAGAAVAAREMQNPVANTETHPETAAGSENLEYLNYLATPDTRPERVPASEEVQAYAAAQQQPIYTGQNDFIPQSAEVQHYAEHARAMAQPTPGMQQPVQAPGSLGPQVNGF